MNRAWTSLGLPLSNLLSNNMWTIVHLFDFLKRFGTHVSTFYLEIHYKRGSETLIHDKVIRFSCPLERRNGWVKASLEVDGSLDTCENCVVHIFLLRLHFQEFPFFYALYLFCQMFYKTTSISKYINIKIVTLVIN